MNTNNKSDWESSETIGPFEKLNNNQILVSTFFGTIIFDDDIRNFVPAMNVLRVYLDESDMKAMNDLIFSKPNNEIKPLGTVLSSLFFDEIYDELIFELPMRIYSLFPDDFDFFNEGAWFVLMNEWKQQIPPVMSLLTCGDVEANPGPIHSRPIFPRDNDPRGIRLEKVLEKREAKIRTLVRRLARLSKVANPRAQGVFTDIQQLARTATTTLEPSRVDKLTNDISRICSFIENNLPIIQANLQTTGLTIADNLVSIKDDMIKIIIFLILFKIFMTSDKYRCAIALVLLFICQHYGLHSQIISLVKELIDKVRAPKAQSIAEDVVFHPIFQLCGKILFAVLAFIAIKQIPGKQDWDSYIMRLDRLPKAYDGANKIIDFTTEYWNLAQESVKMMILGKTREELRAANGIYNEIDQWASEVRKYLELEQRNKIDLDIETANKVEKLWQRGMEFKADKLLSREADRLVSATLIPARSLYEYVEQSPIKGGGPKMKPVCVWLCGESGIGKTEMIYPLCIDVLRAMGLSTETDYQHQVYARQVETEFWDGYKGQKIIIYDDAFQKKDDRVNGNPELFEVIRSCNTFPQHLHMAALHDKNTFSSAELMLYTTNEMNVDIASLTYPAAFNNRMYENAYVVSLKERYRKKVVSKDGRETFTLDLDKIDPFQPIDLDIYLFQKKNENGENVGAPLTYEEFSKLIADQWRRKKMMSRDKLEFLNQYAQRPLAQTGFRDNDEFFSDAASFTSEYGFTPRYNPFQPAEYNFEDEIAHNYAEGLTLADLEYEYSADEHKYNAYHEWRKSLPKASIWDKYIERFDVAYSSFKTYFTELKVEAIRIIKEHPFMTMLGVVGTFLAIFSMYKGIMSIFKSEKDSPHDEEEVNSSPDEDDTTINDDPEIISESNAFTIKQIISEVTSSGDIKTQNLTKPKVEISASGDVKTQRINRPTVEIAASGDVRTLKAAKPRIESENDAHYLADFINGRRPTAQGCSDPQALMLVTDILYKNTYKMLFKMGDKFSYIGNVTFIKGWVAAMPYHFLETLSLKNIFDATLCLTQDGIHDLIQFPVSHLMTKTDGGFKMTKNAVRLEHTRGDAQDCVIFCLHKQMCQPHRNILPHIVKQEDLSSLSGCMRGTMSTFHRHNGQLSRMYHTFSEITPVDSSIEIDLDPEQKHHYTQRSYYTYRVSTVEGDCGSFIGLFSKRMVRKLIGMHIAGDATGIAYACPLTFERIDKAISQLEKHVGPVAQMEYCIDALVDSSLNPDLPPGGFIPIGRALLKNGQATKSALMKSRIYGKLRKATMAPAILRATMIDGELVDPLQNGLKKCGIIPALLDNENINACTNDISSILRTNFAKIDVSLYRRVLSYQEAVQGANDDYMTAVNRTTSPGYPYSHQRLGKPGKTRWLGSDEDFDFTSKDSLQMQKDVQDLIDDCRLGLIRGVYCADTLKDEKRDLEKVRVGKTRVFSACPAHFVLAFRQYFLGFSAWCMHNKIDNEIAVGTNQYSLDWNKIALKLKTKGTPVIAGDFSNFDGSLNAQILWAILDIINDWYDDGDEARKIRMGLWAHVVHSTHIFDDNVYMWTHSQPSGNPFTVIINSIYNSTVMRLAWQIIMKPHGLSGMNHFNTYVSMISYGDDNVLNISKKVIDYFNQETIAEALASIAHTYTDETKSGEVVKYRSLNDINFLKRSFVYSEELQRYIAPIEERVIYEMLNWTRNTIDPDEILMMNIGTAAREMALHGRSKFDNFALEIRHVEEYLRVVPRLLTYAEYLTDFKDNSDTFFD